MNRASTLFRRWGLKASLVLAVLAGFALSAADAQGGPYGRYYSYNSGYASGYGSGYGSGYYGGHRHYTYRNYGPVYHAPSVHYDSVYHPEYEHWTPGQGWHTHGHYDYVPHYTPGHYDYLHGDHIDVNPHYHHGYGW